MPSLTASARTAPYAGAARQPAQTRYAFAAMCPGDTIVRPINPRATPREWIAHAMLMTHRLRAAAYQYRRHHDPDFAFRVRRCGSTVILTCDRAGGSDADRRRARLERMARA